MRNASLREAGTAVRVSSTYPRRRWAHLCRRCPAIDEAGRQVHRAFRQGDERVARQGTSPAVAPAMPAEVLLALALAAQGVEACNRRPSTVIKTSSDWLQGTGTHTACHSLPE